MMNGRPSKPRRGVFPPLRTKTSLLDAKPLPASSTELRAALKEREGRELLSAEVYDYVIAHRLYGAKPNFEWLREKAYAMLKPKRIPHVRGCEEEAIRLARRWGADEGLAAEAAICTISPSV